MSVLAQRFAYGTPILGAVVGLLIWDRATDGFIGVAVLALVFGLGSIVEYTRMFGLGGRLTAAAIILVLGLLGARTLHLFGSGAMPRIGWEGLLLALAPGLVMLSLIRRPPARETLHRVGLTILGGLYIGLPLAALLELGGATEWGVGALVFLVLVVKGNDSGAYLVGRKWGRTPLIAVSPKKTREGAIGGLVVGTAAAVGWVALDSTAPLGYPAAIAVGAAIGIAGQLGDLVESYLKRCAGVKDSGGLIPAFGGILDLLDSILLAGPVLLAVTRIWEGA